MRSMRAVRGQIRVQTDADVAEVVVRQARWRFGHRHLGAERRRIVTELAAAGPASAADTADRTATVTVEPSSSRAPPDDGAQAPRPRRSSFVRSSGPQLRLRGNRPRLDVGDQPAMRPCGPKAGQRQRRSDPPAAG